MNYVWHVFLHLTGSDNASGPWYLWWSGFAGDLTLFAAIAAVYWRHRCKTCWRIGRHEVAGTPYKTCHKHLTNDDHALLQTRHEVLHPEQHAMLAGEHSDG